jgi:Heavy metal binding domain
MVAILFGTHRTSSHEPVTTKIRFTKEIVRIFQDHCLACHQPGSNTKVLLHNYASARPWAKAIKEEVLERRMPPAQVVKGFGRFEDDYGLTQHEVDQIVAWVDGGTPKGDDKDLPAEQVRNAAKERDYSRIKQLTIVELRATEEIPAGVKHYRIENSITIPSHAEAIAIRPVLFPFTQSLEVTAYRPDGKLEVLVWAQGDMHERLYDWQSTFYFKEPVRLPKGTRLRTVAYINNASSKPLRLRSPLCELSLTPQGRSSHKRHALVATPPGADVYTCPMHADVITDDPGTCPKCAMTLVKTKRPEAADFDLRFTTRPSLIKAGQTFRLVFNIHHPKSGATVKDFHIVHEMPFHLFIVSQDLNYFSHLHPRQQGDGSFVVETSVPKPGAYLVYSDVFPVGGVPQVAYGNLLTVGYHDDLFSGRAAIKPDEVLIRELESTRFALTLEPREPVAGKKLTLTYQITDLKTGEPVSDLEPYLGASGHTLILSEDASDYIHSHPTQSIADGVSFEAFLPRSGRYRIWSQFQRHGKVITVPFTIAVKPY